jgi:kynureninase
MLQPGGRTRKDASVQIDFKPAATRFGFTPLYTSFEDVWNAVAILKDILQSGSWDQPQFHQRGAVT